ncbi:hypothetical protein SAY86_010334 [Trapa natans]|uniref:Knottins-like domain-containing protein n=1 Tax=Trapa natans TaxID=22666 RepID=A0AAN7QQC0_TRANT|nr:hypothetical protein SAY86_010334 [Trapa natans]
MAMGLSKPLFRPVFVLLLLLVTIEMGGMTVEGRTCRSQSDRFKGVCFSYRNCASVCLSEDFEGGICRRFVRRCVCTKDC